MKLYISFNYEVRFQEMILCKCMHQQDAVDIADAMNNKYQSMDRDYYVVEITKTAKEIA